MDLQEKLSHYLTLLEKWQKSINLVSNSTIEDAERRHFEDSAQLLPYIPETTKTLADLGCGAGFPGIVLAMYRPEMDVHLIESDNRKCSFMKTVSRETLTPVTVHAERIEVIAKTDKIAPDYITARALASLGKLLELCEPWIQRNPDITLLLLKGRTAQDEINSARESYQFDIEMHPSKTISDGFILKLTNISPLI